MPDDKSFNALDQVWKEYGDVISREITDLHNTVFGLWKRRKMVSLISRFCSFQANGDVVDILKIGNVNILKLLLFLHDFRNSIRWLFLMSNTYVLLLFHMMQGQLFLKVAFCSICLYVILCAELLQFINARI